MSTISRGNDSDSKVLSKEDIKIQSPIVLSILPRKVIGNELYLSIRPYSCTNAKIKSILIDNGFSDQKCLILIPRIELMFRHHNRAIEQFCDKKYLVAILYESIVTICCDEDNTYLPCSFCVF